MINVAFCGLVLHLIAAAPSRPAASRAVPPGVGEAVRARPFTSDEPLPTADEVVGRYAAPVPGTEGMQPTITGMWCSDEHLLCFRAPKKYPGPLQAWRLNTRTGLRTPLPGLTRRLEATRGPEKDYFHWAMELRLSPDGKWLLWPGTFAGQPRWFAATLDGGQPVMWPREPAPGGTTGSEHFWLSDSRRWVFESYGKGSLYSLDDAPNAEAFAHPIPFTTNGRGGGYVQHWALPSGRILLTEGQVSIREGNVETSIGTDEILRSIRFFHFPAKGDHSALSEAGESEEQAKPKDADVTMIRIAYPAGHQYRDCSLSPRGDAIAWVMAKSPAPGPGATFVQESLWVSRNDGGAMRPVLPPGVHVPFWTFQFLSWTPDGRRLSFWHAGRLWTLPVEPTGGRSRPTVP